ISLPVGSWTTCRSVISSSAIKGVRLNGAGFADQSSERAPAPGRRAAWRRDRRDRTNDTSPFSFRWKRAILLLMPGWIGPWELAILLLVVLLVFGPKRLPEMGRSLGKSMREFKDSVSGKEEDTTAQLPPPAETPSTATTREQDKTAT